ncbi:glycosyltransferase family 87 protein [Umezawaea sp.]|uniref:glycosyltransferase family 87 protein n=1 Tax=Umezawaea sp. TaxID=1955258 RepID=UPI002ED382C5
MTLRELRRPGSAVAVTTVVLAVVGAVSAWWALRPSWQVPLPTSATKAEVRMQDFRDATYYPLREFLAGGNPYDPSVMFAHWPVRQDFNLYQPYHLVLHLPFALLDYRAGAVAFVLVSLLLLVSLSFLAAYGIRRHAPLALGTAGIATLLVTSQVGKAQLYLGQVNPLVALGAAGALAGRDRQPRWAAVGLAVAWLKPQFGLPLAVLLFARGSRRVALAGTAIAAVASLPVVLLLVFRGGGLGAFVDVVAANLAHATSTDYGAVDSMTAQRVDLPAVFFRTTGWLPPLVEPVALLGVLAGSAVLLRKLDRLGDGVVADLLTCLAVVVCVVHQPGDVLIAVPAMAALAALWWRRRREPGWWAAGVALTATAFPFLHLHVVDTAIVSLFGARVGVTADGLALVAAWVLLVVFAARRRGGS